MITPRVLARRFFLREALIASALPILLAQALCAQSVAPLAPASVTKLEVGVSYSRGDYGLASDTEILLAPVSIVYETQAWTIRATVPVVRLEGPAAFVADGGPGAGGPARGNSATTTGLSDATIGVTYKSIRHIGGLHTDLTARVKLPTGNEDRGLGTGEIDYHAQIDFYQTFDRITPYVALGYRVLGDGRYQLDDGFFANAGIGFNVAPGTCIGTSLKWRQHIVNGADAALEGTIFAYQKLSENLSGTLYALKGFSDASADYGMGLSLIYQF